jgi:hypothetical protein
LVIPSSQALDDGRQRGTEPLRNRNPHASDDIKRASLGYSRCVPSWTRTAGLSPFASASTTRIARASGICRVASSTVSQATCPASSRSHGLIKTVSGAAGVTWEASSAGVRRNPVSGGGYSGYSLGYSVLVGANLTLDY